MWQIYEAKKAEKNIDRLPDHILEKYEFWKSVVYISGPDGLKKFPGFKDRVLKGEWSSHRSSYLSDAYRVIYKIHDEEVRVYVIDINKHDYRRK